MLEVLAADDQTVLSTRKRQSARRVMIRPVRAPGQLCFPGFRTTSIVVPLALSVFAFSPTTQSTTESPPTYTAATDPSATVRPQRTAGDSTSHPTNAPRSGSTKSPSSKRVDADVYDLVEELRDLPGDAPVRVCTPCNLPSKVGAVRRREIYDQFNALGSAAVPALARMLKSSLRGSDRDLTNTIL